jgi:hypothetical protein
MDETAEALDLMNSLYQLQHLDIKPQNLFLVHNHVKVADFGLVKDLEGVMASVTGGVTPVYAAPETFDGWVSRYSDQYSLAIVYQELLTGQRPFTGTNLRQLVMQHLQTVPDLTSLPASDRPVVGRALAKVPEERYPSCKDFVKALREVGQATPAAGAARGTAEGAQLPAVPAEEKTPPLAADSQKTFCSHGPPVAGSPARPAPSRPGAEPRTSPEQKTPPPRVETPRSAPSRGGSSTPFPSVLRSRPAVTEVSGDGILMPALVIGLGSLGLGALRQLRHEIHEQFGAADALPQVRFLYMDTDPATAQLATRGQPDRSLRASEVLLTKLHRPSYYTKEREGGPELDAWMHPRMLYRMPRQQTSSGIRALGRLAFVDHYKTIARRLELELAECCKPETLQQAAEATGLGMNSNVPRVYIVTSLTGGTGSGMLLDLAYAARHQLRRQGFDRAEIVGVFLLPAADRDPRNTQELANAFAAMAELEHFASPDTVFQAQYDGGEAKPTIVSLGERGPALQRCVLLPLPRMKERALSGAPASEVTLALAPAMNRVLALAGHLLFSELVTPLGRDADHTRKQTLKARRQQSGAKETAGERLVYQTVGMQRVLWPRRQLLEQASRTVCQRLVERWMSKDAKALRESIRGWILGQWDERGLTQERLIARFQQGCEKDLQQPPENYFAALLAPIQQTLAPPPKGGPAETPLRLAAVVDAMEELERLLGVPEECQGIPKAGKPTAQQPGVLEQALADTATVLADEYEQKLAEMVVCLIEGPEYRLAGAEEAIRQMNELVEQALQNHEQLTKELHDRAVAIYQRIQKILDSPEPPASTTPSWRPFTRKVPPASSLLATELLDLLKSYPKCRYQSLILRRVSGFYVGLRGQLSDQLREVDFCRARLGELLEVLSGKRAAGAAVPPPPTTGRSPVAGRYLLPAGCRNLEDAVRQIETGVTAEQLQELDRKVQALLRRQFKALVYVCMTSSNVLRNLAPAMLLETQDFLGSRLAAADVVEMYLRQHKAHEADLPSVLDTLRQDLGGIFNKAAPALGGMAASGEIVLMGVPAGPGGDEFRELARQALSTVRAQETESPDEIVYYREQVYPHLPTLEQLGPLGEDAYRKLSSQEHFTLHSRIDIPFHMEASAASSQPSARGKP